MTDCCSVSVILVFITTAEILLCDIISVRSVMSPSWHSQFQLQALEVAQSTVTHYEYTRIPKSYLCHIAAEEAKQKWQAEWTASNKAAATKQYFPSVQNRLGIKLKLNAKLAAVLTGHGKTRAYLNRFHLRDDARCICGHNDHTVHHLLFHCEKTSTHREVLKHQINQQRNWMEINKNLYPNIRKCFVSL